MAALPDLNALSLPELYDALSSGGLVRQLLELAREEDLGADGLDVTTRACLTDEERVVQGTVRVRSACVLAGLGVVDDLLAVFAPEVRARQLFADGDRVDAGDSVLDLIGPARGVLGVERTLLNLVGRLSGVATLTAAHIETMRREAPEAKAVLVDTRKTTPGMRVLEKYAVRCGGGMCHRIGLYDAALIKDNHLAGVGADRLGAFVSEAADRARRAGSVRFVEVEVDDLDQLDALLALPAGTVDIVLLDNMAPETMGEAVRRRERGGEGPRLEASGGVTLETIGAIARTGVDRISVGGLTHGARSIDFGLDFDDDHSGTEPGS